MYVMKLKLFEIKMLSILLTGDSVCYLSEIQFVCSSSYTSTAGWTDIAKIIFQYHYITFLIRNSKTEKPFKNLIILL